MTGGFDRCLISVVNNVKVEVVTVWIKLFVCCRWPCYCYFCNCLNVVVVVVVRGSSSSRWTFTFTLLMTVRPPLSHRCHRPQPHMSLYGFFISFFLLLLICLLLFLHTVIHNKCIIHSTINPMLLIIERHLRCFEMFEAFTDVWTICPVRHQTHRKSG